MSEIKKVQMVLKIDPKVREQLRRMAAHEGRSLSGQLTHLVRREVQRRTATSLAESTAHLRG